MKNTLKFGLTSVSNRSIIIVYAIGQAQLIKLKKGESIMPESCTFRQCTRATLEKWFGLRRTWSNQVLDSWLQSELSLSGQEEDILKMFREELILGYDSFSEQELSMAFIGPVFTLAHFMEPYRFKLFAGRKIEATVPTVDGEIKLHGEPDGIIATGYWEPEVPLFAFSEYKKTLDPEGDPAGQALAAMLVGQVLNQDDRPLYGCYVVGHYWHFMVLDGREYIISRGYSALAQEIFDIFRILKALKQIVLALTEDTA